MAAILCFFTRKKATQDQNETQHFLLPPLSKSRLKPLERSTRGQAFHLGHSKVCLEGPVLPRVFFFRNFFGISNHASRTPKWYGGGGGGAPGVSGG